MSSKDGNTQSKLSDGFHEVEAKREEAVEEKRIETENEKLNVYFHVAKKGQLGGRSVSTQLVGGKGVEKDNPLRFDDNVYITSDPEEIAFIEGHDSFGIHCFKCENMQDALARRATSQAIKQSGRQITVDLEIRADGIDIVTAE